MSISGITRTTSSNIVGSGVCPNERQKIDFSLIKQIKQQPNNTMKALTTIQYKPWSGFRGRSALPVQWCGTPQQKLSANLETLRSVAADQIKVTTPQGGEYFLSLDTKTRTKRVMVDPPDYNYEPPADYDPIIDYL